MLIRVNKETDILTLINEFKNTSKKFMFNFFKYLLNFNKKITNKWHDLRINGTI